MKISCRSTKDWAEHVEDNIMSRNEGAKYDLVSGDVLLLFD